MARNDRGGGQNDGGDDRGDEEISGADIYRALLQHFLEQRDAFGAAEKGIERAISIARRLQDPLAELVKIDPQHVGVGLYQHDVKAKHLKESLEAVIESSVNQVGVDLNTASVPLLRHVSGMNQLVAREVVNFRERNGPRTAACGCGEEASPPVHFPNASAAWGSGRECGRTSGELLGGETTRPERGER